MEAKWIYVWLIIFDLVNSLDGQWWMYSRVISQAKNSIDQEKSICYRYLLNDEQLKICQEEPRILYYLGQGTNNGLKQCQKQFYRDRWTCSNNRFNNRLYKKKTRETAYVNAISSAGVIHKLAEECDKGTLTHCGCRKVSPKRYIVNRVGNRTEIFYWSNCKQHLQHASRMSRIFLDPSKEEMYVDEHKKSLKKLVVAHNNRVARKLINEQSKLHKKCSCYGPTGECFAKTCYRWIPKLPVISEELYRKYTRAVKIKLKNMRRLISASPERSLLKTDLVYSERLSYCEQMKELGIPGTKGRICLNIVPRAGDDMASCDVLCCGRGANSVKRKVTERCRCTFSWCCDVKCDLCEKTIHEYVCK